jgi:hypothetical protein
MRCEQALIAPSIGLMGNSWFEFDSFVDSFAGRLPDAPGDVLRRMRHTSNTGETPWHTVRCSETICRESLNPKVQGSIPCASTNM